MTKDDYEAIYEQYRQTLKNFIRYKEFNEQSAEDIAQESMLIFYNKYKDTEVSNVKSCLYCIAENVIGRSIQRSRAQKRVENDYFLTTSYEYNNDFNTMQDLIRASLSDLDYALFMKSFVGFTNEELAVEFNCCTSTIRRRLCRIKKKLKPLLHEFRKEYLT